MRRILVLVLLLSLVAGCGKQATPRPTSNAVETQVAILQAAAATLTARAAAGTVTPMGTAGAPTATGTSAPPAAASATPVLPTPILVPSVTVPAPSTTIAPPTATRPAPTFTTAAPTATKAAPTATKPKPTATKPKPTATRTKAPPTRGPSLGDFAVVGVYAGDVLNVRVRPGVTQPIAGTVPYYGRGVQLFSGEQKVGGVPWVPVRHGQVSGWSNRTYLARQVGDASDSLAMAAAQAVLALRDHDMADLAALAHPAKGIRFSPYTFVRTEADKVFSRAEIEGLWSDPMVYHWGTYDGSGLPIDLTFRAYYADFVYDVNFAQPEAVGFDAFIGSGNTINNVRQVYPLGTPVEYHFPGFDKQYGGMDWRSLRLIFEQAGGSWFLVGIVHDEWTI